MRKFSNLLRGLGLSAVAGTVTGCLIFLFKLASSAVMDLSKTAYGWVRENPKWLPVLLVFVAGIGLLAALFLQRAKDCRGGGIPAAAVSVRGRAPMRWVQSLFGMFLSSLLTYLGGVPLGNEGPSVQMGAAAGKGTMKAVGRNCREWDENVMGGSASAGFAVATGAPLAGIVFAVEEMHLKISLPILLTAVVSVLFGTAADRLLTAAFHVHAHGFGLECSAALPLEELWIPALIGVLCGSVAVLYALAFHGLHRLKFLKELPFTVKITVIFAITAVLGFFSQNFLGSGAGVIDSILQREMLIPMLFLVLLVRCALMLFANHEGVSGGTFIPNLTFGALLAAVLAQELVSVGMVDGAYFGLLIVVGMTAFLSASNRTPITAVLFAVEVLCGLTNILPLAVAAATAFAVAKLSHVTEFAEVVIEARAEAAEIE